MNEPRRIRWDLVYAAAMTAIVGTALAVAWVCDDEWEQMQRPNVTVLRTDR